MRRTPKGRPVRPSPTSLALLDGQITACQKCPRLRSHCQRMAREKRASYRDQDYYGKPIPNFGDPDPGRVELLIVGLAPAAHGANRTGRMFTGDRSGDFLYRAMHEAGFASQPTSVHAGDGLTLHGALVTAACHCAPPGNKPTPQELATCSNFLDQTFDALPNLGVVLCLGRIAFDAVLRLFKRRGWIERTGAYRFGHGVAHRIEPPAGAGRGPLRLLCSYHPSQQNTFTGKLTAAMMREVFEQARIKPAARRGSPASA